MTNKESAIAARVAARLSGHLYVGARVRYRKGVGPYRGNATIKGAHIHEAWWYAQFDANDRGNTSLIAEHEVELVG